MRASPGAAVKLCLGDLLVMGSNPEIALSFYILLDTGEIRRGKKTINIFSNKALVLDF